MSAMNPFFTLLNIVANVLLQAAKGQVIRLDIGYIHLPPYGCGLFYPMKAEQHQVMDILIDTGSESDYFFFAWKQWYEKSTGESCDHMPGGCYACDHPCTPREPMKNIEYEDGVAASIFQHKGKISVGTNPPIDLTFGLLYDQDPPPTLQAPVNTLGLGPYKGDPNFPSLMKQLQTAGKVKNGTFALCLFPSPLMGVLMLGGGYPSLYKHPLQYVELGMASGYTVKLDTFQVGSAFKTIGIKEDVYLDTGRHFLYVSQPYYDKLIKDIKAEANKAAHMTVPITFDPGRDVWTFPCQNMTIMPPLTFGLGPSGTVPLTMSYMNYAMNDKGHCYFIIKKGDDTSWAFPDRMLIGNYLEFQPEQGRVGIAPLVHLSA
ncbi:hypothetical protein FOZ61_011047 [Perkinsus olseni]|uniref:Peptidase A1 domain-containing protein n=1 Tax=Perkinsus olseni TaxID=32597 RepID=A0A7J6KYF4_PEROL|nr:hypothetical protein FOZ61_011047 [Perkinsus olseni]KAF4651937.1 hypothetical protein FOL46_009980 [Perkinsus olseni]